MSQHQGNPSGRRSGRGGRRRGPRGNDSRQDYRPQTPAAPAAPEKQSFLQKVIGFFKPKKAADTNGRNRPAERLTPTVTSSYPTLPPKGPRDSREPRAPREDRDQREDRPPRDSREDHAPRETREPRPARKPEAVEVTTPKLYVGNLSFDASESDLSELFAGVGQVQTAEIVAHKDTERSKGFAFVTMTSIDEAKRAVTELHDKDFMGRKLVVSGAKTPIER